MAQAKHPARIRLALLRTGFIAAGLCITFAAVAAAPPPPPLPPPPLPPPALPSGAQPGGAQPVMPPPTVPIPENNLDLSVPPVYERPLGAEEGERVFVKRFVITGVVGDRRAGIDPAEIQRQVDEEFASLQKIAEQQRLTKQNLEKQGPEGFTPEEQDKIIKFMQGAVKTQSPEEQQKAYQTFIQQLMLERLQRLQGLTIGQLQGIADNITKYYHDKGYFLARAVIPAQEIKDGVVNIRVLEGRLEKVQTSGNKMYSDDVLSKPFKPLLGDLVTVGRTENALLTLTKYPGLSAAGLFRPGGDVGTTDIVLNVQHETPLDGDLRYDNYGTAFTGRKRLIGSVDWNDPTGAADLLTFTALHTFGAENSTPGVTVKGGNTQQGGSNYFDLRYSHPLFGAYDRWALDISRNSFSVGGITPVGGTSKIAAFSWEHDYIRSRELNIIGTLDFSRKRADTVATGKLTGRDDLAVLGYQLNIDSVNTAANTISSSYVRLEHGFAGLLGVPTTFPTAQASRSGSCSYTSKKGTQVQTTCNAGPAFNRLVGNYQLYKNLPDNQGLLFRVNGQYSTNMLTSLEQYVLGGPDNVRAAPTSQFLTDKGLFGSLEYSVRAPGFSDKHAFGTYTWGQVLRFRLFEDAAKGWINDPSLSRDPKQPTISNHYVAGLGVGVEFTVPGTLTADLQWARLNGGARKGTSTLDTNAIPDSSETWFDITVNF